MKISNYLCLGSLLFAFSCSTPEVKDPMPSWNNTPVKEKIISYVENEAAKIPVEDRIAVFDMDGTIACERPLWFEMAVAVQHMSDKMKENPELGEQIEYQYADKLVKNPEDSTVLANWFINGANYLDSVLFKSFEGVENEEYVDYAHKFLNENEAPNYGMKYADMFYQPMLEFLDYLCQNQFKVYIVSGSMQGIVWSVCPQNTGFERERLIGTRQAMDVTFPNDSTVKYMLRKGVAKPKNNYYGKAVNIYTHIGKVPVMAIGNTTGDFGMFHMASASKYPHFVMMLNHDDAEREYAYVPYYGDDKPNWQDSLQTYGWLQADMSKEFKTVWMEKK